MNIKRKKGLKHSRIHHNKKLLWVIGFLVLVLIVVIVVLRQEITKRDSQLNVTEIANPASVFCIEQGGSLELVEDEQGVSGMCTLPNGEVCEEWALFRAECGDLRYNCVVDSDCVKVQTSCCSCSMGGEEKCVNSEFKSQYEGIIQSCSPERVCAAVFNCDIKSCGCVKGICSKIN